MREMIVRHLRNASVKKRRNLIDHSLILAVSLYKKLRGALARSNNKTVSKLYIRARKRVEGKYSFVSVEELVIWTTEWIKSFPTSYDVIVGIPRSGLLVANTIALKLGKPLTTPELFGQACYWKSEQMDKETEYRNILLVDDSIVYGKNMEESLQLLRPYCENLNITKAALLATKGSKDLIDLCYKIIPHQTVFEWNLLHAKQGKLVSDLDGVICENCPPGVDCDEELYIEWIKNAKPYLIPAFKIDVIVSNRVEKYRSDTEEWLAKHGVGYKELILWDIQSKQERGGKHAQRKIEVLLKIKPDMFWESSFAEAERIWEATKIPTLCIDEMILFS